MSYPLMRGRAIDSPPVSEVPVQAKASWVVPGQKPAQNAVSHALPEQFRRAIAPARKRKPKMAKIAKTGDRKKVMDTSKSTNCPKCGKPTRIVKRVKDRERGVPGGVFISCSACEFYEKL
jgi:DNA-directed RNA polymerase subunit M/transcription elongation factor TFIIS